MRWLPSGLQHLSLVGVTLGLPQPQPQPPGQAAATATSTEEDGGGAQLGAPTGPSASASAGGPHPWGPHPWGPGLLPRLDSISAVSCCLPPLAALLPTAGCSHLTRLVLSSCQPGRQGPCPSFPTTSTSATAAPSTAAAAAPTPAEDTRRGALLALEADLEALVGVCGGRLRSLRVTAGPAGPPSSCLLWLGGSAHAARLAAEALGRLPALQALCWEAEGEDQQDRLLEALGVAGLRELRELTVCRHVG